MSSTAMRHTGKGQQLIDAQRMVLHFYTLPPVASAFKFGELDARIAVA